MSDRPAASSETRPGPGTIAAGAAADVALERALEGLFRLTGNRRFDDRQARAVGAVVTRAGYALLRSLEENGPLGLGALAAAAAMDTATASRQVNRLVDEGLVSRRTDAADGRAVLLALTERGGDVYRRIVAHRLGVLAKVLDGWPVDDRVTLAALVERLSADLGGRGTDRRGTRP